MSKDRKNLISCQAMISGITDKFYPYQYVSLTFQNCPENKSGKFEKFLEKLWKFPEYFRFVLQG